MQVQITPTVIGVPVGVAPDGAAVVGGLVAELELPLLLDEQPAAARAIASTPRTGQSFGLKLRVTLDYPLVVRKKAPW